MLEKAGRGEIVDYVAEFAGKLPMDVISELMGVPEPDRDRIRAMADGVMHREDGVNDVPADGDRGIAQPDGLLPGDGRRAAQDADRRPDHPRCWRPRSTATD